jgi:hypothetical protein
LPSINSDDENNKNSKLIVLNEQLQPMRPLRPKASTSSINNSNSNNSSRPISHISDDGTSQLSLLPENDILLNSPGFNDTTSFDTINNSTDYATPTSAPPKPALPQRPLNLRQKIKQQAQLFGFGGGSSSNNSNNSDTKSDKTNSSTSLNEVQYRNS